jgi:hypothetical protein
MNHRVRLAAFVAFVAMVPCMSACGSAGQGTQGPTRKVCGTTISVANMAPVAPWYVDLATSPQRVLIPGPGQGMWLQLSHDCSHGAMEIHLPAGYTITDDVRAEDGSTIAAFMSKPDGANAGDLVFTDGANHSRTVQLEPLRLPPASSPSGP